MIKMKYIILASAGLFLTIAPSNFVLGMDITTAPKTDQIQIAKKSPMSDAEITKEIKKEISADKAFATNAPQIEVKTENGIVTLSGTVNDQASKFDAEAIAKDVAGDNNVVDIITVKNS